jgi:hypothetical protein
LVASAILVPFPRGTRANTPTPRAIFVQLPHTRAHQLARAIFSSDFHRARAVISGD